MTANDSVLIRYSIGRASNLGKVENLIDPYSRFKDKFRKPPRTNETLRAYSKMTDLEQKNLKSVAGFFFRSQAEGGVRNRTSGLPSDILTFDFDNPSVEFFQKALRGELLPGYAHFIHSTRRHTPEKPRFRLVVLVTPPVSSNHYPAVSRILARQMDPKMEFVDPVSFRPAQMMFFPTLSSDSEFVFEEFEGAIFDPTPMLDQFETSEGDWRDITLLPRAVGEAKLRESSEKAENPLTKTGIVGTFCRAYSIQNAIAKFLPTIYTPVDLPSRKPRYTYAGGTTVNGAEVQDDGAFLYSHHGSDPCSDQLVNAFDMVRIHLHGREDKDFDPDGKKVTDRPSWKSMVEFVKTDAGYKRQQIAENYDVAAMLDDLVDEDRNEVDLAALHVAADELVGDVPPTPINVEVNDLGQAILRKPRPRKPEPPRDAQGRALWIQDLEMNQFGGVVSNLTNISRILAHDPRFRDHIGFNEFENRPVLIRDLRSKHDWLTSYPVANPLTGEPWQDAHDVLIRAMLEDQHGQGKIGWGVKVSERDLKGAVMNLARSNTFNPVKEALLSFEWDGVPRVASLFIDYLGSPDDAYHREVASIFCIAAVTRIFEPGHKFDSAPVLWGPQGVGKSTFIRTLAMEWFGELTADFSDDQKLAGQMIAKWIMELPELTAMMRSMIEPMKAFMSGTEVNVRMPYDKSPTVFKRQTVFMGSTNNKDFLKDETGNRRFFPVEVITKQIDTDRLRQMVPLIWAEVVVLYQGMRAKQPHGTLPLILRSAEAKGAALDKQSESMKITESDVAAGQIQTFLDREIETEDPLTAIGEGRDVRKVHRDRISVHEIMDAHPTLRYGPQILAVALGKCGWTKTGGKKRLGGKHSPYVSVYVPGPEQLERWAEAEKTEADDLL